MKKTLLLTVIVMAFLFISTLLYAQAEGILPLGANQVSPDFLKMINSRPKLVSEGFEDTPIEKFGNGVINAAVGWADIPTKVVKVSEENDVVMGSTFGLAEGVVSSVTRTVSGTYDVITCGFSPYDKPSMKTEYKVNKPQEEGLKVNLIRW